jgi:hypothetical protein
MHSLHRHGGRHLLLTALLIGSGIFPLHNRVRADSADAILKDLARAMAPGPDQAFATCTLAPPEIRDHRAHGRNPLDCIRNLTFRNAVIEYNLRYWMNVADPKALAGTAIEGSTGLGLDKPTNANWYLNNFLEILVDGKPVLKQTMAAIEVLDARGPQARARFRWQPPEGVVTLEISLGANNDFLTLKIKIEQRNTPKPVRIGLRAYPGHYPAPRRRCVSTILRDIHPVALVHLKKTEPVVILFDELDPRTACAADVGEARCREVSVDVQRYPVTVRLDFPATKITQSGPIRIWEFAGISVDAVMERLWDQPPAPPGPAKTKGGRDK